MVTSKDILERTGLKSAKTLTRWYRRGIIPKPSVRIHPSGRGKIGYWPDWVLERCVKLVELQKQGHALRSAMTMAHLERVEEVIKYVKEKPSVSDILANKQISLEDGRPFSLLDVFLSIILKNLSSLTVNRDLQTAVLNYIKQQKAIDYATALLHAGYNPVLIFDGSEFCITADFVISHWLTDDQTERHCYLVLPLVPSLREAYSVIGLELSVKPIAFAAPKMWVMEGDTTVEYTFYPGGPKGFELIRQTATIVGTVPRKSEKEGEG